MAITKDITIPKEVLNLFPNAIRIIDKKHLVGIYPVDPGNLRKLQATIPELFKNEVIKQKFDVAIGYDGKSMKVDFNKLGIPMLPERIVRDIWIHGIPIPWIYLKKAGIDNKKFNFVLVPKV
jgi:hypothetical protein